VYSSDFTIAPKTLGEAYSAYKSVGSSVLVGGGWGLKNFITSHYDLAIELKQLEMNYIRDDGDEIVIGAMTDLAALQRSPLIRGLGGGVLSRYVQEIQNADMKRSVTLGGILAYKYPFSVMLPILLSMNVDVELYDKGRMSLDDYVACPPLGELITQIAIAKERVYVEYAALRNAQADIPYLTGAVSMRDDSWRIILGGRPSVAALAENASELLTEKGMAERENAAHVASEELDFAGDDACSEQERRKLAITIVRDMIKRSWKGFSRMLTSEIKK